MMDDNSEEFTEGEAELSEEELKSNSDNEKNVPDHWDVTHFTIETESDYRAFMEFNNAVNNDDFEKAMFLLENHLTKTSGWLEGFFDAMQNQEGEVRWN